MKKILHIILVSLVVLPGLAHADIIFSGVSDIVQEAASAAGASVPFNVSATDASSTPLSVTCDRASGDTFSLGTTTVSCEAADAAFATSTTSFSIRVTDTMPPIITPPAEQSFATTSFPAIPTLVPATAADLVDASPVIAASVTTFGPGTTTVTWTATDNSGNSSATTSLVIVTDASATSTATTTDTAAPTFTAPAHTMIATSSFSFMPQSAYPAVSDDTDTNPLVTYVPPALGAGTTTVVWTATDASGNSSTSTSDVFVFAPLDTDAPDNCTVVDTDGNVHAFPDGSSPGDYLGICMLEAAKESGLISGFEAVNSPFGLYIQSVDGIAPGATQYWAVWDNEVYASVGITEIPLSTGDILSFILTDWTTNTESAGIALQARSLTATATGTATIAPSSPAASASGGGGISHLSFNVPSALLYLSSVQNPDGSFSSDVLTDWAALAFAASEPGAARTKLRAYLLSHTPSVYAITDYERHAMALMALGINPYSGTGADYISPIVASFDGTQIGDASLDNDDIFALFPLTHAGYDAADDIIQKTVAFIVSRQSTDGSWDASADITASAIQALAPLSSLPDVAQALARAERYLREQQQANGGFGNSFATSWAMQAIGALAQHESAWAPGGYYPRDYLASLQQSDGGVGPLSAGIQTRIWATEYAVPAALGKTWATLLQDFSKPVTGGNGGGGQVLGAATSTPQGATTTPAVATSTTPVATSTVEMSATTTPEVRFLTTDPDKTAASQPEPRTRRTPEKQSAVRMPQPQTLVAVASASDQTASAAPGRSGFLAGLWHAITSFFFSLF